MIMRILLFRVLRSSKIVVRFDFLRFGLLTRGGRVASAEHEQPAKGVGQGWQRGPELLRRAARLAAAQKREERGCGGAGPAGPARAAAGVAAVLRARHSVGWDLGSGKVD